MVEYRLTQLCHVGVAAVKKYGEKSGYPVQSDSWKATPIPMIELFVPAWTQKGPLFSAFDPNQRVQRQK